VTLFEGYETDKANWYHGYGKTYEQLVGSRRESVTAVLELGIFQGGSLKAWADYFPHADIVGVDIDPQTMIRDHDRISTYVGNVRNRHDLTSAAIPHAPFDLVVDDASHLPIDQFHALKVLWKYVKPGGFYCIEDLDLNRQGAEILITCHLIVRGSCADLHLHLGDGSVPASDILILEKG
jgi:trans-aconitate methyltransferase